MQTWQGLYTIPLTTIVSNLTNSGTIEAYAINASTSGSATFPSPICASASEVLVSATTGVNGVGVVGVAAPAALPLPVPPAVAGPAPTPVTLGPVVVIPGTLGPGGIMPRLDNAKSGVVYAEEGVPMMELAAALERSVSIVDPVCERAHADVVPSQAATCAHEPDLREPGQ